MVLTLIFDTETTGLPRHKTVGALQIPRNWPDLVSICWIVFDGATRIKTEYHIIRPEGWTVPAAASQIHGITEEVAVATGVSLAPVLESFKEDCKAADRIVAHNLFFDRNVVFHGFKWRLGEDPISFWDSRKEFCTMMKSKDDLKIPSQYPKPGDLYKFPSLDELYRATFGSEPPGAAHSADRDVDVLKEIYWRRWG